MNANSVNSFLTNIGYDDAEWLRPLNLHAIIVETNSNQYFNPKLQKIYFDNDNEIVKIKYSDLIPVSAILRQFTYNPTNNSFYFMGLSASVYQKKTIREPKPGDYVYCYNKVTDTSVCSEISTVTRDIYGNITIVLADNTVISAIENATNGLRFFILLQEYYSSDEILILDNPAEYYCEKDLTNFDADIFIDYDKITGFDFGNNYKGVFY